MSETRGFLRVGYRDGLRELVVDADAGEEFRTRGFNVLLGMTLQLGG